MSYSYDNKNDWDPYHLGAYDWAPFFEEPNVPAGPYDVFSGNAQHTVCPEMYSAGYGPALSGSAGVPPVSGSYGQTGSCAAPSPYGYTSGPHGYPPYPGPSGYGSYSDNNYLWIVVILVVIIGGGYYLYKNGYFI